MPDISKELRDAIAKLSEKIADEELARSELADHCDDSLRADIIMQLTGEFERELETNESRLRENLRKVLKAISRKNKARKKSVEKAQQVTFVRFNRVFRFQHMVLFVSLIILVLTGMPMKFSEWGISQTVVDILGGGEQGVHRLRLIHRIAASGLIFFFVFHMLYSTLMREGRRDFWLMIPRPKDLFDVIQMLMYFVGWAKERPKFDRFSYIEKFDYWAVYWGCVVMISTGATLWFNEFVGQYLPKWAFDLARIVHSDEALLATLALVIWHFYNVHFNPDRFPGSLVWWHGRLTEEEMIAEHPLEYERIIAERKKNQTTA